MMYYEDQPLRLNKETDYYEGVILKPIKVKVEKEILKAVVKKAIDEDSSADLTDPTTFEHIIEKVNHVAYWLGRPHTEEEEIPLYTPLDIQSEAQTLSSAQETVVESQTEPEPEQPFKTQFDLLIEELRAKVPFVPPFEWEYRLRTPLLPGKSHEEKQPIYARRHDEKRALQLLFDEWKQGKLELTQDAYEKQREHELAEAHKTTEFFEAVAEASNGNRIH